MCGAKQRQRIVSDGAMAKINCWLKRRGSTKLSDDLEHVLKIAQTMNTFITSPLTGCLPNKESEVDYKINAFLDSCKWEMEFEHLVGF